MEEERGREDKVANGTGKGEGEMVGEGDKGASENEERE